MSNEIVNEIVDEILIEHDPAAPKDPRPSSHSRRAWKFCIRFNGKPDNGHEMILPDPLLMRQYEEVFANYVRHSGVALFKGTIHPDLEDLKRRVEEYRDTLLAGLFRALGPVAAEQYQSLDSKLKAGSTRCKITIHEELPKHHSDEGQSLQKLIPSAYNVPWELLERATLPEELKRPGYRFQVCRVLSLRYEKKAMIPISRGLSRSGRKKGDFIWVREVDEPLYTVAHDTTKTYKILLVLARRLGTSRSNQNLRTVIREEEGMQDVKPDLAQWPLMRIQKQLEDSGQSERLLLDVVRPGSFAELLSHLARRKGQDPPICFNLLHFDLHGRIAAS
jgi:hypothetical protein